jgi:CBS domain-containing protein
VRTRALSLTERAILCVLPDATLVHVAAAVRRIGGAVSVVVVDDAVLPLGIVNRDTVDRAGRTAFSALRDSAGDVMHPVRVTQPTDVTISLASAAMAQADADEIPLVGSEGDVIAVLRSLDVIRWFAALGGYELPVPVNAAFDSRVT